VRMAREEIAMMWRPLLHHLRLSRKTRLGYSCYGRGRYAECM
jgi:hypothetical protein